MKDLSSGYNKSQTPPHTIKLIIKRSGLEFIPTLIYVNKPINLYYEFYNFYMMSLADRNDLKSTSSGTLQGVKDFGTTELSREAAAAGNARFKYG